MSAWIKVEDRMPDFGVGILVTDGEEITCAERIAWVGGSGWTTHNICSYDAEVAFEDKITHWMPLPAPPEK